MQGVFGEGVVSLRGTPGEGRTTNGRAIRPC